MMATNKAEIDDFFSVVRRLERKLTKTEHWQNQRRLLGTDTSPADEPVRFRFHNSTAFSAGLNEVCDLEKSQTSPPEMLVNFLGLIGPSGTMPQHYTRLVIQRVRQNDNAAADFINIFNHRLISLYYRAWCKYKLPHQYERYNHDPQRDPFTRTLKSLSGRHDRDRYDTPLFYSGHFSKINRSGSNLQSMVQHFLGINVQINSFIGQWLLIEEPDRLKIGSGKNGRNHQLGSGVLPGRRFWDIQSKITLTIGPITHQRFHQLLPGSDTFSALKKLINAYTPSHIHIDLWFIVKDAMKNSLPLGKGIKLSQNAWLHGPTKDPLTAKISLKRDS